MFSSWIAPVLRLAEGDLDLAEHAELSTDSWKPRGLAGPFLGSVCHVGKTRTKRLATFSLGRFMIPASASRDSIYTRPL